MLTKSNWSKTALYLARYLSLFIFFFLKFFPKNEQLTGSFFVFSIAWQAVRHSCKNVFKINLNLTDIGMLCPAIRGAAFVFFVAFHCLRLRFTVVLASKRYKGFIQSFWVWPNAGLSNLLTKCANIFAKNLEWAIIVKILCDVLWGFRPAPGLFL